MVRQLLKALRIEWRQESRASESLSRRRGSGYGNPTH
jgi:hypothetical protein